MLLNTLLLVAGIILLYYGATWLIKGAVGLAFSLGVSTLVIGLTVVAFGTSMPEMVVSLLAAFGGSSDIAIGNIVGSNIANIGLILGIAALISPLHVEVSTIRREIPIMIAASIIFFLMAMAGTITFFYGLLLLIGMFGYTWYSYYSSKKESASLSPAVQQEFDEGIDAIMPRHGMNVLWVLLGLGTLVGGAELLVRSSSDIARAIGVSERLIGLTVVAVGTSLPELATSIVAALKKESDIAVGNIVGSNVFNIFGILGTTAMVTPIRVGGSFTADLIVMLAYSLILLPMLRTVFKITRLEGGVLLATYVAYVVWISIAR